MRVRPRTAAITALGLSGLLAAVAGQVVAAQTGPGPAEGKALANAGVVQQNDLPEGYAASATAAKATDDTGERAFYECMATTAPTPVAQSRGSVFVQADKAGTPEASSSQVDSVARVLEDSDAASANQELRRSDKGADCFKQQLLASIAQTPDVKDATATTKLVPITVEGADEAWAYAFDFNYVAKDQPAAGTGYLVGSRVGETLIDVTYAGAGRELSAEEAAAIAKEPVARVKKVVGNAKPQTKGHDSEPAAPGEEPADEAKAGLSELGDQVRSGAEAAKPKDDSEQDKSENTEPISPEIPSLSGRPGSDSPTPAQGKEQSAPAAPAAPAAPEAPAAPQEQSTTPGAPGVDPLPPAEGSQPAAPQDQSAPSSPGVVNPAPPAAGEPAAPAAPEANAAPPADATQPAAVPAAPQGPAEDSTLPGVNPIPGPEGSPIGGAVTPPQN
ncbi:MAG: hypothetical protein ACT4QG_11745 [Sporichthyaceae bacterium]